MDLEPMKPKVILLLIVYFVMIVSALLEVFGTLPFKQFMYIWIIAIIVMFAIYFTSDLDPGS